MLCIKSKKMIVQDNMCQRWDGPGKSKAQFKNE